jgi:hypothetical protein
MKKQNLTHTIPATRVSEETRNRVQTVAEAANCDMADIVRDALRVCLIGMELQLGISTLDDYEEQDLIDAGLGRLLQEKRHAELMARVAPRVEDRTAGLAWGPPAPQTHVSDYPTREA